VITIPERHGQTDGQTDGLLAVALRGKTKIAVPGSVQYNDF